jgi:formylglycine-generating enzyme required for sulfatase activity
VDIQSFRDRLKGLDALLRNYGMGCGIDVWQSVFLLLEHLEQQSRLPDNPQQLAPLLGPLFCRNPEDQARFPVLFEQWLNDGQGPSIATNNRFTTPEQPVMSAARAKINRSGWFWIAGSLTLLAILMVGILFWPKQPLVAPPPPLDEAPPTFSLPKTSFIQILDQVTPRLLPEPIKLDETLQQRIEQAIKWLPWGLALLWLAQRYQRRWRLQTQTGNGDDLINNIRFERLLTPIFGGAEAERALRDLRSARVEPTRRLDLKATVEATARSGDYFHPVYLNRRFPPEHLLLVRSLNRKDQQAALAEELVKRFNKLGLQVKAYRFRDDPRWLLRWVDNGENEYVELSQLVARHGAARLLIISETDILFHPFSGEARPWLTEFAPWQDRIWLHPRDADPEHAALLAKNYFTLLPLARDSLPELVARLTRLDAAQSTSIQPPLPLPDLLAAEPDGWLGDKPPYGVDLADLVRQLEHFLGSYGLRLLRAVAVYPQPHWDLTLALDFLLYGQLKDADPPARREQRLARLCRLPWLKQAHLPQWLRDYLLINMSREERQIIVHTWQRLFKQVTEQDGEGMLKLEIRTSTKHHLKWWLADLRAMKNAENINDPIFINILLGGKLGLLDFQLPQALAKLLPNTGHWLYVRPALLAIMLATFSMWGLAWTWQHEGKPALSTFLQDRIDRQNADWQVNLTCQPITQKLADALVKALQTDNFKASQALALNQSTFKHNQINYPVGAVDIANQVAQHLRWLTYGAAVTVTEAPALPAKTLLVQLGKTYQHTAGFNDSLSISYQAPEHDPTPYNVLFEPQMININPGTFMMGSTDKEAGHTDDESPQHQVTFTRPFAIGKYEVTVKEYAQFAEVTRRKLPDINDKQGNDKLPVTYVSFADAQAYAAWLSQQTGKAYRLPSEAEWEYAARAGSNTAYWWGDSIGKNHAVCNGCGSQWDGKQTAPVGSLKANKFGLYDTAGNVWEFTQDCWHNNYDQAPTDGSAWLEANSGECGRRVVRGGSWINFPRNLRSAFRVRNVNVANNYTGFRVARAL